MASYGYESPWYGSEDSPYDSGDSGRVRVRYIRPATPQWGTDDEQEQDRDADSGSEKESEIETENEGRDNEDDDNELDDVGTVQNDADQTAANLPPDFAITPPATNTAHIEDNETRMEPSTASEAGLDGDDDHEKASEPQSSPSASGVPGMAQPLISGNPSISDAGGDSYEPEIPPPLAQQPTPEFSDHSPAKKPSRYIQGRRRDGSTNPAKRTNKAYIKLLNRETAAAYRRKIYTDRGSRIQRGSQIHGSWWKAREKEKFFNALAVLGEDNIHKVAAKVKTKSVLECTVYLRELKVGLDRTRRLVKNRTRDSVTMSDIPAAVELSDECIGLLDYEARKLARNELAKEEKEEKEKWGEFWSIDAQLADHLSECWENEDVEQIDAIAPEAELLNVSNMLGLSMLFFMNCPGEDNYRNISDDLPAIRYTALIDFHTLVIQLTRRLVTTAISLSNHRVFRAKNGKMHRAAPWVPRYDVNAAARMCGVPTSSRKFWIGAARRNKVGVVQGPLEMKYAHPRLLTYEVVEGFLSKLDSYSIRSEFQKDTKGYFQARREEREAYRRAEESVKPKALTPSPEDRVQGGGQKLDTDDRTDEEEEAFNKLPAVEPRRIEKFNSAIEQEDKYLEVKDARDDQIAEIGIWEKVLPYVESPLLGATIEEPKNTRRRARNAQATIDWRQKVRKSYKPLWMHKRVLRPWEELRRKRKLIKLGLAEDSDVPVWEKKPGRARWNPPWLPPWRPRKYEEGWDGGADAKGRGSKAAMERKEEQRRLREQTKKADALIEREAENLMVKRAAQNAAPAKPPVKRLTSKRKKAKAGGEEGKEGAQPVKSQPKRRATKRKISDAGGDGEEERQAAKPRLAKSKKAKANKEKKSQPTKPRAKSSITKRKKAEADGDEEEPQPTKKPKGYPATSVSQRSPRKARTRRQSSVHPGYVSIMEIDMGDGEDILQGQAEIALADSDESDFEGSDSG